MLVNTLEAAVCPIAYFPASFDLPNTSLLCTPSTSAGGNTEIPSRISFQRIRPIFTHPAVATATNGTNLLRRERVAGEIRVRRGTRRASETAMVQDAAVAEA